MNKVILKTPSLMIPKIIHQIAPANKDIWHVMWHKCYESWQEHFTDYEFKLWDDDQELDAFVKTKYPDLYQTYLSCPIHIIKIDFARLLILNYYGGMYVDMDMYCYKDFTADLNNQICLIGSPWRNEQINNCLMAGIPDHDFWKSHINDVKANIDTIDHQKLFTVDGVEDVNISNDEVLRISGPYALLNSYNSYPNKSEITILPSEEFQQDWLYYGPEIKTRHFMTGRWGREYYEVLQRRHKEAFPQLTEKEYEVIEFYGFRQINMDNFDFKTDYST